MADEIVLGVKIKLDGREVDGQVRLLTDDLNNLAQAQRNQNNAAQQGAAQTGSMLNTLRGTLREFAIGVASAFTVKAVFDFGAHVIKVNREMEDLRATLTSVTGSAQASARTFAAMQDFARDTPFEVRTLTDTYIKLRSFGLEPTNQTMLAITNQASKLGASTETLKGITLALGQAWAKGKLQGEEILQLVERGVPVWEILAKATGKNALELQTMADKGELGRAAIHQLIVEMGELANGSNAEAVNTISGAVSNLSDAWTRLMDNLLNADAESALKEFTTHAAEYIGWWADKVDELNAKMTGISTPKTSARMLGGEIEQLKKDLEKTTQDLSGALSSGGRGRVFDDYVAREKQNLEEINAALLSKTQERNQILATAREQEQRAQDEANARLKKSIQEEEAAKNKKAAEDGRKKAVDHAASVAKQQAKAETSRREEIAKTIAQIQQETSLIGLGDKERARSIELTKALAKAKGDEIEVIKSALEVKWAELDADARRNAMQEQSLSDAIALKDLKDAAADAQHLAALAKELKAQGLSNDVIRERIDLEAELADARKTYMSRDHDLDQNAIEENITARRTAEAELAKIMDDGSQSSADFMETAFKRAAENIQDAMAEMFENLLNGDATGSLDDFIDNIRRSMNKVFSQQLAASIQNWFKSAFTSGVSSTGGGASAGGGIFDWVKGLFGGNAGTSSGSYFKGNGPLLSYQNPASSASGGFTGMISQLFSTGKGGGFSMSSSGGGGFGWGALASLANLIPGAGSYQLKGGQRNSSLETYFKLSNTITDMIGNFFPIAKLIAPFKNLMLNLGSKIFPDRQPSMTGYAVGALANLAFPFLGPAGHLLATFLLGKKIPQPTEFTRGTYSNGKMTVGKSGAFEGGDTKNTIDFTTGFGDMITSLGHQLNMTFRDFSSEFWHQFDKGGDHQFAGFLGDKGGSFMRRHLSEGGDFQTLANQASLAVIKRNIASQDDLNYREAIRDSKGLKGLSKRLEEIDQIGLAIGQYGEALQSLKAINAEFDDLAIKARKYRFAEADIEAARQRAIDALKNDTITAFRQLAGLGPTLAAQLAGLSNQLIALEANARSLSIAESDLLGLRAKAIALAKEQYLSPLTDVSASITDQIASLTGVLPQPEDVAPLYQLLAASTDPTEQARYIERIQRALTQRYNIEIAAINKTAQAVNGLKEFVDSLKLSNLSPLDPLQRLQEAKGQYGTTLLKAQAGDQSAIAKLPDTAQAYLTEARSYYASTPDYAAIFQNVTDTLTSLGASIGDGSAADAESAAAAAADTLAASLQSLSDLIKKIVASQGSAFDQQAGNVGAPAQGPAKNFQDLTEDQMAANIDALPDDATKAQKKAVQQLNKMLASQIKAWLFGGEDELAKTQAYQELTGAIKEIQSEIKQTKKGDPQRNYLRAQLSGLMAQRKALGKVKFKEQGGWTDGMTIVGENGPELINFARPTQVQSNRQTQSIIAGGNDKVVSELQKANEELSALVRLQMKTNQALLDRLDQMAGSVGTIERKTRLKAAG
jgi:tape measure domain-containing protein